MEDAGRYSCVVSNTAGSHHRDVQLVVQGESWAGGGGQDGMGEGAQGELDLEHLCLKRLLARIVLIHCRKFKDWTKKLPPKAKKLQNKINFL